MLTFKDIFKKSFLNSFDGDMLNINTIFMLLCITLLIGCYIFLVYRVLTRRSFYSQNFGLSLVSVAVITAAIILTIRGNLVISLGMVGALSIVRFRTAIKDPLDLMFLFWSISTGIICGAGQGVLAIVLAVLLSVVALLLQKLPLTRAPMILVVSSSDLDVENTILEIASQLRCYPKVKSRSLTKDSLDLTIEVRCKNGAELIRKVGELSGIRSATLLDHTGDVTFAG